jgi:transposase
MIPKTIIGMDLGKHKSQIAVLGADDKVPSTWRISNTPEEVIGSLEGLERPIRVVMEACANWSYFYELLEDKVDDIQLAHPLKTKAIAEARIKTDKIDAGILAQLGKADFVYKAYIPDRETRDLREVLRHRAFLVRLRTRIKNRVHGYLTRLGVENPFTDLFGKKGLAWLADLGLREPYRKLIDQDLKVLTAINTEIKKATEEIEDMADEDKRAELLLPIRGIGPYTAMLIVAEIGDVHRFPAPKKLVSFAGLCPSTYQTGQTSYHGHLTKQGSKWLRWAMVEAAQRYAQAPGRLGHFYRRLARKKGTKTARVALARRLLMLVYTCLKKGEAFKEDLGPTRSVITLGH